MAEARHKPPMQPWLAPVSNRLFGWTENGCEGTSPSAELRFQHSASPPSAAGRFPRLDTLPPRLPRALPPAAAPPPAPPPLRPRPRPRSPAATPALACRAGCGPRAAGLGGAAACLLSRCFFQGPGSGALLRTPRAFFPRSFPRPLRSVISQVFLSLRPPPSPRGSVSPA